MLIAIVLSVVIGLLNAERAYILKGSIQTIDKSLTHNLLDNLQINIRIDDVSLQDVASVLIAARVINIEKGQTFPFHFEMPYPNSLIGAHDAKTYRISASIKNNTDGALVYITDTFHSLPTFEELESEIVLSVVKVFNEEKLLLLKGIVQVMDKSFTHDSLENTQLFIKIEDVSFQDAPSKIISSRAYKLEKGQTFPVNFELSYPYALIGTPESKLYRIAAHVKNITDGRILYITDTFEALPKTENLEKQIVLSVIKVVDETNHIFNPCYLPVQVGQCFAYIPKYYYDSSVRVCKSFVYGGCGGNENSFDSEEECDKKCKNPINNNLFDYNPESIKSEKCKQDVEIGPCRASFERFYFNKSTQSCELFHYGGCLGNENNFLDYESCTKECLNLSNKSN